MISVYLLLDSGLSGTISVYFYSTAVKIQIHFSGFLILLQWNKNALLCAFRARTYLSPFTYVCVGSCERSCRVTQ